MSRIKNLSMIVAFSKNQVIGAENKMPWHLPEDLKYFKKITLSKTIFMGKNTFLSINKALPKRENIVLSTNLKSQENIKIFNNKQELIAYIEKQNTEVFCIGGANIYQQFLSLATKLYITHINADIKGDTFFPKLDFNNLQLLEKKSFKKDLKNKYDLGFCVYQIKK